MTSAIWFLGWRGRNKTEVRSEGDGVKTVGAGRGESVQGREQTHWLGSLGERSVSVCTGGQGTFGEPVGKSELRSLISWI